jgi:TetR/AcrR family transcriptional regulator
MPGMEHTAMNPVFDAPPGNPFARDFEHGAALFDAAVAEFVARGYEQASINTILAAAGMSKGQFYYHFGSKEALYFALIDILIAQKQAFLRAVMRPEDLAGDIFDIFQAQIGYSMAFAREHPVINRFSESFLRERGNAIYKAAMARYNFEENAGINDLIDAAHTAGRIPRRPAPALYQEDHRLPVHPRGRAGRAGSGG